MNEYRSAAILKRAQNLLILHRAYKLLAADAEWDESKHPRAENGRFGAGNAQPEKQDGQPQAEIPEIKGNELGLWSSMKELREKARAFATRFIGKKFINSATGHEIEVTMKGVKHTIANANDGLIKTIPAIPDIIRMAELTETKDDKHGDANVVGVELYRAILKVEGRDRKIVMTVKHYRDGRRYYDHGFWADK